MAAIIACYQISTHFIFMEHERFLRQAIALAVEKIAAKEGGPFAALVVADGEIIGRGWNRVTGTHDPTAHAEIVAIRDACRQRQNFNLGGATLYVNCEPCPMCLAAAYWAGIGAVWYAADRRDAAAIGFADQHIYDELARPLEARALSMHQLLREEALPVFRQWAEMPDKVPY